MADAFTGIRLKLSRARDQINGLKHDFVGFLRKKPYSARFNFDDATGVLTASVHISHEPDPMWGVRLGEIAHNLRSALDHTIWQLVILTTGRPPVLPTKNQFPIFKSKEGFRDRGIPEQLRCVRQDAVVIIESEQPYFRGEGISSPLWHLQELSNVDKHRTIHIIGTLLTSLEMVSPPFKFAVTAYGLEQREPGPIQEDVVLLRLLFRHASTGLLVDEWPFKSREIEGYLAVDIAFDQGTPAVGGALVFPTLEHIATRTERAIRRIATEIFKIDL